MGNSTSIIFYCFVITIVSLLASISQKEYCIDGYKKEVFIKKKWIILSFIIAWAVMGLRYDVGSDYFNYIKMFNEINNLGIIWALKTLRTEPLYAILNWLIGVVFKNHHYVFVITSFVVLFFIYKIILNHKNDLNIGVAVLIFMIMNYFSMFTFVRLSIALVIIFNAYKYLVKQNKKMYIISVLLAAGFHYTAFIMLPIYYLLNRKNRFKNARYFILFLLSFFLLVFFQHIGEIIFKGTKYYSYFVGERLGNLSGGMNQLIIHSPLVLIAIIFRKRLVVKNEANRLYLELFFLGSFLMIFSIWLGILNRMLLYFLISQVLIFPQIFRVLNKHETPLFSFLIITYYIFRFSYSFVGGSTLLPYDSILNVF